MVDVVVCFKQQYVDKEWKSLGMIRKKYERVLHESITCKHIDNRYYVIYQ